MSSTFCTESGDKSLNRNHFIARSHKDVEELRVAVRKGRLFDVQEWIAAGKPLYFQDNRRKQALQLAVESCFHSMVEILAAVWPDQKTLNEGVRWDAYRRREDLVWLLLDAGAEMKAVDLESIAGCYDKELLSHFLTHWDALEYDYSLADAILAKARPLIGVIKSHASRIPNHQAQFAYALNQFIQEENAKWVSLTLWMGADPRQPGPTSLMGYSDDPEDWMSPMEYALFRGFPDAVKLMKPHPALDDLNVLLSHCRANSHDGREIVEYLVGLGANINNLPNGGSSILSSILVPWPRFKPWVSSGLTWNPSDAEEWIKRGARFMPQSDYELRDVRKSLCELSAERATKFLELLSSATTEDILLKLFNTPKLRATLRTTQKCLREKISAIYDAKRNPPPPRIVRPVDPPQTVFLQARPSIVQPKKFRVTRRELYEKLWTLSIERLEAEYGVSHGELRKLCVTYKIPKPGRDYWIDAHARQEVAMRKLSKPDWNPEIRFTGYLGAPPIAEEDARERVLKLISLMSFPGFSLEIPKEPERIHPILEKAKWTPKRHNKSDFESVPLISHAPVRPLPGRLDYDTVIALHRRVWRVLNAALLFLESLGFTVSASEDAHRYNLLTASLFGEDVLFRLSRQNRILRMDIHGYAPVRRTRWCDGKNRYLEAWFAHFACTLAYIAAIKKSESK